MSSLFDTLSRLIFPPRCAACKTLLPTFGGDLCDACQKEYIEAREVQCPRCVQPMHLCDCSSRFLIGRGLETIVKLYRYRPHLSHLAPNRMIFRLKKSHSDGVASFLARELAPCIRRHMNPKKSYVLVGVPRSKSSIRKYGYDHVTLLLKHLSRALDIPIVTAIERCGKEGEQKNKSRKERMQAAARSFMPVEGVSLKGKSVILVDDVVTSGATFATCAKAVRILGARGVFCAVVGSSFGYGSIAERKVYESVRHEIMERTLMRYYRR